jgi:antitoxin CptB
LAEAPAAPESGAAEEAAAAARLRWKCRRGMLELDLILLGFLDHGYESLAAADRRRFERLLECSDHDLLAWLMGREPVPDPEWQRIVAIIRTTAGA